MPGPSRPHAGAADARRRGLLPIALLPAPRLTPAAGEAGAQPPIEPEPGLLPRLDRRGFVTAALASGFAAAVLPVGAQTITTDAAGLVAGEVRIPVGNGEMPAYRAMPAGGRRLATVLVVHEVFGVHEHIRDVCRRFARLGYLAVAPELFARQGNAASFTDVQTLRRELVDRVPDAQVLRDLDAALVWTRVNGGDRRRIAITGFCWGGRIAWLYAAHTADIKAAIAWYGRLSGAPTPLQPRQPLDVAARLKAPVLGLYAGRDAGIAPESVLAMRAALRVPDASRAARVSEIVVYPEAQHGFYADYRPVYSQTDADAAFARAQSWLATHGVAAT